MATGTYNAADWSFTRPDLACLARQGCKLGLRYTSIGSSGKNITKAEADQILKYMDLAITAEESANFMLGGASHGTQMAKASLDMCRAAGSPPGIGHYFALDIDPNPLTTGDWNAVAAFLDAARDVLRPAGDRVGLYGGFLAVEKMVPSHAEFGWQTYAWSGGRRSSKMHLYQWKNGVSTCGGEIDYDEIVKTPYGGWKQGGEFAPTEDDMPYADWPQKDQDELVKDVTNAVIKAVTRGEMPDGSKPSHLVEASTGNLLDKIYLFGWGDGRDKDLTNDTHGDINVRAANDRLSSIISALEQAAAALTKAAAK